MKYKIIKYGGVTKIKDTKSGESVEIDIEKFMHGGSIVPKYVDGVEHDCAEGDIECLKRQELLSSQPSRSSMTTSSQPSRASLTPANHLEAGLDSSLLDDELLRVEGDTRFLQAGQKTYAPANNASLQSIMETENARKEQEFEFDINRTTEDLSDINSESYNIPNPYAGVDIPSAANYLGQSIKNKSALGIASSSLKLVAGLGRNVVSGLGAANRENQVLEDYYKKQKDNKNQVQYLAYGGKKDEDLATGEYMHGISNENIDEFNAEIERGEYFQSNEGDIAEVIGDKHASGGEKIQMEAEDRVLSDKLKLGAKTAKMLSDKYGIKLKAKNTYSDVLDKFKRKSKLGKLVEEEAEILKKIGEQDKIEDTTTRGFNLDVLSKKKEEIEKQKHPIEEQRKVMFEELFNIQEASKPKSKDDNNFETGGKLKALSAEYGISLDRAKELITEFKNGGKIVPKYEHGVKVGDIDPETGKRVTQAEADKNVKSGEWEDLGSGRYKKSGTEGSTSTVQGSLESYRATWDKDKFPVFEDYVAAAEKWKEDNPNWEKTTSTAGTNDEFFYTEELGLIPKGKTAGIGPIDVNREPVELEIKRGLASPVQANPIIEEEEEIITKERGDGLAGAYLFPSEQPLPPSALQGSIKPEARFDRVSPNEIEVEPYLQDIKDREGAQVKSLEGLSPNVRAAVLANMRANSQTQESDTRFKIDSENLKSTERAEYTNAQLQRREQILNNNYRQGYEQRVYTAQAITDNDTSNYYDQLQSINKQKFMDVHNLNLVNATNEDVAYIPGRGYVRKNSDQDILRKIKV